MYDIAQHVTEIHADGQWYSCWRGNA